MPSQSNNQHDHLIGGGWYYLAVPLVLQWTNPHSREFGAHHRNLHYGDGRWWLAVWTDWDGFEPPRPLTEREALRELMNRRGMRKARGLLKEHWGSTWPTLVKEPA